MRVILRENVDKLGKAGDLVKVKPGYARNYLIPKSLAVSATRDNIKRVEHERKAVISQVAKLKHNAEDVAAQLNEVTIRIAKPVGDNDRLYGSVTTKEIIEALEEKGFSIDRKKLELSGPIKQTGEFEIVAKLGSGVSARFKLVVEKRVSA
ncbi:MAG: 50S ribosomal protein L9 [Deltaproteobacteria bacterium]|nr:50S ribosomal protein L9 [Deltaproteobacteria bacterium]